MRLEWEDLPYPVREQAAKQILADKRKQTAKSAKQYQRTKQAAQANAEGHHFEDEILKACKFYRATGRASVDKTPESFRVTKLLGNGAFQGRFTGKAQPDFQGVLDGGRAILFDAKYTGKDRISASALTKHQAELLEIHSQLGAVCGVCVGMQDGTYFVPWDTWKGMQDAYGRKYMTKEELEPWRLQFSVHSFAMFLDYEEGSK
ncbi:MAG: Holliday junction resolvase RecU [Clostridiales bacterium]|nr:Holliday junction resolvase RecU [Clostridiales bacterium]